MAKYNVNVSVEVDDNIEAEDEDMAHEILRQKVRDHLIKKFENVITWSKEEAE